MELISWSLYAIDTSFSTKSTGAGDPACPDGTRHAGYVMDAREKWRGVTCLAPLSVMVIVDDYIFGFMMISLLLIGFCCDLILWRIKKTATTKDVQGMTVLSNQQAKAETVRWCELFRKVDNLGYGRLRRKLDVTITERVKPASV